MNIGLMGVIVEFSPKSYSKKKSAWYQYVAQTNERLCGIFGLELKNQAFFVVQLGCLIELIGNKSMQPASTSGFRENSTMTPMIDYAR